MIERISRYFVPVAVDLLKIREAKNDIGEFFRRVNSGPKQWQGLWIATPDGELLAAHHDYKSKRTWTQEVLETIDRGLKRFGPVAPRKVQARDFRPYRGKGIRPDGGIELASYIRYIHRGKLDTDCVIDRIILTQGDFASLAPPSSTRDTRWLIPAATAKKLCRCLSPDSDLSTMPRPEEVTEVRLQGRVVKVLPDTIIVTYEGKIAAVHKHLYEKGKFNRSHAEIAGVAEYDRKAGKLRAIAMVLDGVYFMFQPWHREPRPFVAGVEWQLKE